MLVVLVVSERRKSNAFPILPNTNNVAIDSFLNPFIVTWLGFQPATSSFGSGRTTTWAIVTSQHRETNGKCFL